MFVLAALTMLVVPAALTVSGCAASRPNERTPMGVRPDPIDEASEQELTGARQREGIAPPKTSPESGVPPLGVHRAARGAPASSSSSDPPLPPPP